MFVLDTSVVVALYVPEAASARAQRLLASRAGSMISPLTEVEFTSAIARLVRIKALSGTDGRRVVDAFAAHVEQRFYASVPITPEVFALARQWIGSFRTALRTLDALQLAAAHHAGQPFVTADKALTKAATELGVAIRYW